MRKAEILDSAQGKLDQLGANARPGSAPARPEYSIQAIRYATIREFPVSALVMGAPEGETLDIAMVLWLIRGGGHNVLFDSGFHRAKWLAEFPSTADFLRPDEAVRLAGVSPEEITDVIVSHAHWDHMGGIDSLPQGHGLDPEEEFALLPGSAWQPDGPTRRHRPGGRRRARAPEHRGPRAARAAATASRSFRDSAPTPARVTRSPHSTSASTAIRRSSWRRTTAISTATSPSASPARRSARPTSRRTSTPSSAWSSSPAPRTASSRATTRSSSRSFPRRAGSPPSGRSSPHPSVRGGLAQRNPQPVLRERDRPGVRRGH